MHVLPPDARRSTFGSVGSAVILFCLLFAGSISARDSLADEMRRECGCSSGKCQCITRSRAGSVETTNFWVRSPRGGNRQHVSQKRLEDFARRCEGARRQLAERWFESDSLTAWAPRCEIVLHASMASYVEELGRGAAQTLGATDISFSRDGKKITRRRIDLLAESIAQAQHTLPHELTHVVMVGHFNKVPPRWADEGMAVLADTPTKRQLHHDDLHAARRDGSLFTSRELLRLDGYPAAHRTAAFYGQSAALVAFLVQRETPARFVRFVERSQKDGHNTALREIYDIGGEAELDQLWRKSLTAKAPAFQRVATDETEENSRFAVEESKRPPVD